LRKEYLPKRTFKRWGGWRIGRGSVGTRVKREGQVTMEEIVYKPIGIIHTPFKDTKGMPNQPTAGKNVEGMIEIQPEYIEGLDDIEGFSQLILIYHFHFSVGYTLKVKPFMHDRFRGVFATRSPRRPNPIGISVVRLVKVKDGRIYVKDLDIADGTPLLDIKPYIPDDSQKVARIGWLSERANQVRKQMQRKRRGKQDG
jgi:tRNA-Thr(GGU) m(6)t(6)A37 methyltransferase TsaA